MLAFLRRCLRVECLAVLEQHVNVVDLEAGELLEGALDVQQQSAEAGKVFPTVISARSLHHAATRPLTEYLHRRPQTCSSCRSTHSRTYRPGWWYPAC